MSFLRFLLPVSNKVLCQDDWKSICHKANPSIFKLSCARTHTSCGGFFISTSGVGISAYHFYEEVNKKTSDCKLIYNNTEYDFEVLAISKETHTILIKGKSLPATPFLEFSENPPNLGTEVILFSMISSTVPIFEPGYVLDLKYTRVAGVDFQCYRSSCRGGPGYSGGPLINRSGKVLGMHKSHSTLFSVFDSVTIPSSEILNWLKKIGKNTSTGWQF